MHPKRAILFVLSLLMSISCSSGSDSTGPGATNVATVEVAPLTPTIGVDSTLTFTATALDGSHAVISGAAVRWSTSDPTKATIDANGVAHGVAAGVVAITAASGTQNASTVLSIRVGTVVSRPAARVISTGIDHACSLVSATLYCWGADGIGEIGVAATSTCTSSISGSMAKPCVPSPERPSGGLSFVSTAAGGTHSCGLTSAGKAYCWGDNANGQLGIGSQAGSTTPVAVNGNLTFASLAAGYAYTCGLSVTGAVYCWGRSDMGQVGAGITSSSVTTPQQVVSSQSFVAVATGWEHACAIAIDGTLYCWGRNNTGQLGAGAGSNRSVPILVPGSLRWKQVAGGAAHSCALTTTGAAYCWGSGAYGQIGDGGTMERDVPAAVSGGITFSEISAGFGQSCGIRTDGHAFCWGENASGELGDNGASGAHSTMPVAVSGGLTWTQLAAGAGFGIEFTCGISAASQTYCWGEGTSGQLGDGAKTTHKVPTAISGGALSGRLVSARP